MAQTRADPQSRRASRSDLDIRGAHSRWLQYQEPVVQGCMAGEAGFMETLARVGGDRSGHVPADRL